MEIRMTEEEEFFAWLDGELDSAAAAKVEARLAADSALAAEARAHRALGDRLRGAFEPLMTAPVPDRIAAPPVDFAAARERRAARPIPRATQWAAMAATLAIGIVTGTMIASGPSAPVALEGGALVASGEIEQALDTRLASAPASDGARIGLTFRDRSGAICRSFEDEKVSGLACRADGDWKVRGLFQRSGEASGDYRMAAGGDPRLAPLVDESIAGDPLDAAAEQAAQRGGWR
jgi:hypothetical protein